MPPVKVIETRIEYKEKVITEIEEKIVVAWKNNEVLENKVAELEDSLLVAKEARDTIKIIQWQDTTITTLKSSNDTLKQVISLKDSIIVNKDYIIESKDTINKVYEKDLKKLRRQRIILGGIVAVLAGIGIAK